MVLPMVVFPHPDSPTSPNVSPRYTSKDTSSTAFNNCPLPTSKCFFNPFTSSIFSFILHSPLDSMVYAIRAFMLPLVQYANVLVLKIRSLVCLMEFLCSESSVRFEILQQQVCSNVKNNDERQNQMLHFSRFDLDFSL